MFKNREHFIKCIKAGIRFNKPIKDGWYDVADRKMLYLSDCGILFIIIPFPRLFTSIGLVKDQDYYFIWE